MLGSTKLRWMARPFLLAMGMLLALGTTGCQVDIGGQTHPSAYYMHDDVQYFPPGPEFRHAQEAAVLKQHSQDAAMQR